MKKIQKQSLVVLSLLAPLFSLAGGVSTKNIDLCIKAYSDKENVAVQSKCADMAKVLSGASNGNDLKFDSAFCVNDNSGWKASQACGLYDVVLKATVKVKAVDQDEKF